MKKYRKIFISLFVLVAMLVLTSCFRQYLIDYVENWGYIEDGFSEDLNELLYDDYQISIPENAVFIQGRYISAREGTSLYIYFKIPCDASMENEILGDEWKDVPTPMLKNLDVDSSISFSTSYGYGDAEISYENGTSMHISEIINVEQYYYFRGTDPSEIVISAWT